MEQTSAVEYHEHSGGGTKEIIRVTIILTILTIVELALGFSMVNMSEESLSRHLVKGVILILMLAKAFYIVGYFMHLKHELRNLIMTICIPLLLFVWFIIAFLFEGNSYKNNRETFNPYYNEKSKQLAPAKERAEHSDEPKKLE
ncbi:MAG: cytochrome C oxidase subunit IV family protein [Bacteroidota bacterium]|nr:cytochrome C oxidase subunit IV family protein [Bacteroidota bacterium]